MKSLIFCGIRNIYYGYEVTGTVDSGPGPQLQLSNQKISKGVTVSQLILVSRDSRPTLDRHSDGDSVVRQSTVTDRSDTDCLDTTS
jgi:hypothetical protein